MLAKEAIRNNDLVKLEKIIKGGLDVNIHADHLFKRACEFGTVETVKLLKSLGSNIYVNDSCGLLLASKRDNYDVVEYLIEQKLDLNSHHGGALNIAVERGCIEIIKLLIDAGVDPKSNKSYILTFSAGKGNIDIVSYLLLKGLNPNANAGQAFIN